MIFSNVFLILPVVYSIVYHEWLYLFLSGSLLVFSPLYHWYKIYKPKSSTFFMLQKLDVGFGVSSFLYMYYFIYKYSHKQYGVMLYFLLTFAVLFFLYAQGKRYNKLHPWFHLIAPAVSSGILILSH